MIVIDDFIKDKKYLKELNDKKHMFFENTYGSKNYHHDVNWWKGWWKEEAKNINEELVEYLVKNNSLIDNDIISRIKGFEYWTHIHSNKSSITVDGRQANVSNHLGWHTNKDEVLHYNEDKFEHPIFSIIFWPFEQELKGGYLEMSPIRQVDKEIEINGDTCEKCFREIRDFEIERIKPEHNRLVIQDPSYWHRVTDVEDGIRWTFVVDVWDKEIHRKN